MADYTISITNSVNTFAPITNKWNERLWNAFLWGEGTNDLPVDVDHLISESITPDSALAELASLHLISETLSPTTSISYLALMDGSGYYYIYPSNVINHENQSLPSYTSGSLPSGTWTSGSVTVPTWS